MKLLRGLLVKGILAAVLTAGLAVNASAQLAVFDPTNFVENFMTALQTLQTNVQEAQQIQNQLNMYQNMLRNTGSLSSTNWANASSELSQLANIAQQGQAISYASTNLNSQFQTAYPGYTAPTNYQQSYQQWTQTSLDSMRGALNTAGYQNSQMPTEEATLAALRNAATGANGQKAALDAGNQIAMAQVSQLQELRQLTMAQMQSQSAYQATQVQQKAAAEAAAGQAMQYVNPMSGYTAPSIQPGTTH